MYVFMCVWGHEFERKEESGVHEKVLREKKEII